MDTNIKDDIVWQPSIIEQANDRPMASHDEPASSPAYEPKPAPGKPEATKPLTKKQGNFVRHLIDHPKDSATEAASQTYKVKNRNTARMIASENLAKPAIRAELAKYSGQAELVILEVLEQSRKEMYKESKEAVQWAVNARQTADSLLDRVHGKATIKTESISKAVTLNIDLTGTVTGVQEE